MNNAELLKKVGRVKEIQAAIVAPYLTNTDDDDIIDFTCIRDSIGEMKYLSTQVIQDTIDELQGELDGRVEPEAA